ncbi:MAG: acyltransferase domain-containing protein [Anaerolineae bacterium]
MTLAETLRAVGLPDLEPQLAPDWDRLMAQMPESIPFLQPAYVEWAADLTHLTPEMTAAAQAVLSRVAADAALRALAWYCHCKLFADAEPRSTSRGWPLLLGALGTEGAGMFNVLVLFSGTPHMLELHRQRGIPADVTDATMLDLRLQLETQDYLHLYHHWGLTPGILGWLLLHWRGELVRLGRLQFATSAFRGQLRAYRQTSTGAVVALSQADVHYRADGQVDGAGGVLDGDDGWTATLAEADDAVTGYPMSPWGPALAEPVSLRRDQWQPVLTPGDPVLDIHIATGSPMDYDECGESIRRALAFFPRHFPDRPFVGFACGSWILDSQFEELLPASSNLVRFQREMYLYPLRDDGHTAIRTVFGFGADVADLARFPRRTGMQRAFAAHLEAGKHFHAGGCFLLKEDADWGSTYYRNHWSL